MHGPNCSTCGGACAWEPEEREDEMEEPITEEVRRMRRVFCEMSLDDLVNIAASAMVAAEIFHGGFCRGCGRRLGIMHATECAFAEGCEPVESFDALDIDELVRRKAVEIRGRR